MTQDRVVMCMKWGDLYSTDYVNLLYRAVCDHLDKPFRFVCLTEKPEGLLPEIEHIMYPDLDLEPKRYKSGIWPKLGVLSDSISDLKGRCLFIDLDSVIVGSLEPFFEAEGDLIMLGAGRNWKHPYRNLEPEAMSGVFAFDVGSQQYILDAFMADKEAAFEQFANETQVIGHYGRNITFWPQNWVVSFKRHLCQPPFLAFFLQPRRPKPDALIVAFHGEPRPVVVVTHKGPLWMNFPRFVRTPVTWVRDYWIKYGYKG